MVVVIVNILTNILLAHCVDERFDKHRDVFI